MLTKHYSPKTKIRLNVVNPHIDELVLNFADNVQSSLFSLDLSPEGDLIVAASNLYNMLRELVKYALIHNCKSIAVANIANNGIGMAINDRLKRAAA